MHTTAKIDDFVRLNHDDVRYMVANFCTKYKIQNVEDMIQEVYCWLIEKDILNQYNPLFTKNGRSVKMSTYLYSVIRNVIRGKRFNNEGQIIHNKFVPSSRKYPTGSQYVDDVELALRYNDMAVEYENTVDRNEVSDDFEGLGADLKDFEERYLPKDDKAYSLNRRRDQSVKTSGTTIIGIFKLLKEGYSSREISRMFGISDMFVSNMKKEIADSLRAYGLSSPRYKRRKNPK